MHLDEALLDTDGRIADAAWRQAVSADMSIGVCHCGEPVWADVVEVFFGRRSYTITCFSGHEAVVPATRVVREPTREVVPALGEDARALEARRLGERELVSA